MNAFTRRQFIHGTLAGGAGLAMAPMVFARQNRPTHATGVVYHDRDGDGRHGSGDAPLEGVAVSNGREVTLTDEKGRWQLPLEEEYTTLFVIKPRGFRTAISNENLPRHYYHHQPDGSPKLKYPGVQPTGPLPESIDFPLQEQEEADQFTALMCGDPQPRNWREVGYLARTAIPELREAKADFGVSLGDVVFDRLDFYQPLSELFGLTGKTWYNLLGNHDLNFDAEGNRHCAESFRAAFGPTWFAFDHGPVHFIVMNNIDWLGPRPDHPSPTANYRGNFGDHQLEFVANDLKNVPEDRLVVLLMHIPLRQWIRPDRRQLNTHDREKLYRLIEHRPNVVSFCGHIHHHYHRFIGPEEDWQGEKPLHQIVTGTLCGAVFAGAPDEDGVPHGTMSDGTPRGYVKVDFSGTDYRIDGYEVIGRPNSYQMAIDAPEEIPQKQAAQTSVTANVFNGNERSKVRMRLDRGDSWREMARTEIPCPRYVRMYERDRDLRGQYRPLRGVSKCKHLWRATLPEDLPEGTHLIEVVAEDMFGNVHHGTRPIRVTG